MKRMTIPSPLFLLLLCACAAVPDESCLRSGRLESAAAEKYGAGHRTVYNSDRSYAIVRKQEEASALNPGPALRFFIYDVKKEAVLFEDTAGPAKVRWKNSREIEVTKTPGAVRRGRPGEIRGYRLHVVTGLKSPIPGNPESREERTPASMEPNDPMIQ